jgi:Zn-dependent peptidase ImmA (M78 family)
MQYTRAYCKSDDKSKIERRANAFAAELLMPSPMFRSAFNELHALGEDLVTVTTLAGVFRVSYEATVYRLNTLGYVTDGQKKKLLSPNGRKDDLKKAHQNGSDQRVAKIRTPALLAALGQLDSQIYCLHCSAILLDSRWSVCPNCGTECI